MSDSSRICLVLINSVYGCYNISDIRSLLVLQTLNVYGNYKQIKSTT